VLFATATGWVDRLATAETNADIVGAISADHDQRRITVVYHLVGPLTLSKAVGSQYFRQRGRPPGGH
jgi:hypothetical protein